jgi:hypothetical protein
LATSVKVFPCSDLKSGFLSIRPTIPKKLSGDLRELDAAHQPTTERQSIHNPAFPTITDMGMGTAAQAVERTVD